MGFPNKGVEFIKKQLLGLPENKLSPVFISIGKNRTTPLSRAIDDYKEVLKVLYPFADVFVINISSPNTKDLRNVFSEKQLPSFLRTLRDILMGLNPKNPPYFKNQP